MTAQPPCPHYWPLALLALALTACSSTRSNSHGAATPAAPPEPYVRVARPDAETVELQIAVRKFVPARGRGPAIWLAGATHIGDSNYYAQLQRHLDAQTLVFYEGVGEHPRRPPASGRTRGAPPPLRPGSPASAATNSPTRPERARPAKETPDPGSLQSTMAKSLGLVFQLEAVDYDRPHFFNSDLSIAQLQTLLLGSTGQVARTEGTTSENSEADNTELQSLLKMMDGSSPLGALLKGIVEMIGSSPKLQAMTKVVLIETLGALRGDPSRLGGLPPDMKKLLDVLIVERNKAVVTDLRAELKTARRDARISVFYGAGHLPDLDERLRRELRYRPAEDFWLTAFSVNTTKAGLSGFELGFLRMILRTQLSAMQ